VETYRQAEQAAVEQAELKAAPGDVKPLVHALLQLRAELDQLRTRPAIP
jgi:hypothetical protein